MSQNDRHEDEIRQYIESALSGNGIRLFSLYRLPDASRICYGIGLESADNPGIEPSDIQEHLRNDRYRCSVPDTFIRASSSFLHMEIDVTVIK